MDDSIASLINEFADLRIQPQEEAKKRPLPLFM
jgi:hypothetical protein